MTEEENEEFVTTSMATLPSSEFPRTTQRDVSKEVVLHKGGYVEQEEEQPNAVSVNDSTGSAKKEMEASIRSSAEESLRISVTTLSDQSFVIHLHCTTGPGGIPNQSSGSLPVVSAEQSKQLRLQTQSARMEAIQKLPLPRFEVRLERLQKVEKFDAFSEDEEPVLRKDYQKVESSQRTCSEADVQTESIHVYNVRKDGVTQFKKGPRWDINTEAGQRTSSSPTLTQYGTGHFDAVLFGFNPSTHHWAQRSGSSLAQMPHLSKKSVSMKAIGRHTSLRKSRSRTDKQGRCGSLNENFEDTTPHQRDLFFVSFEELTIKEVEVIKGLWKSITSDLWTFGALTTMNLFKLRGHIIAQDAKVTPEVMMQCRFLWPHANQVMKVLETVVMNLERPSVSTKVIYEAGRSHWHLKIPISEDQKQLCINAFLYTFADHVHPRLNLSEMRVMRKFCAITMFLFADASRWDSDPVIPF